MRFRLVSLSMLVACAMPWCAHALLRTASETQPAVTHATAPSGRGLVTPKALRLPEPSPSEAGAQGTGRQRAQIGFRRSLGELRTAADVASHLDWVGSQPGRQAAALAITSPGASALRVALRMGSVPRGTRFRFAATSGHAVEVDAGDVEASVARNVYYGEDSPAAHLFWSPVIEGDTAIVEIDMPVGASIDELHVALPLLSHLVTSASQGFAAACGPSACDDEAGPADGSAIARIVFTEDGATYACNGMLVADRDPGTVIPFFLTSRHCIASQSAASNAQPYWPRGGNACAPGAALEAGAMGATLLQADASTDLTLIRLQHAPAPGATYAGWMVGTPSSVTGAREAAVPPSSQLIKARFDDAAPTAAARAQPVVATLGQCGVTTGTSARFEAAYNAGLYQWLGGTPQDARGDEAGGS